MFIIDEQEQIVNKGMEGALITWESVLQGKPNTHYFLKSPPPCEWQRVHQSVNYWLQQDALTTTFGILGQEPMEDWIVARLPPLDSIHHHQTAQFVIYEQQNDITPIYSPSLSLLPWTRPYKCPQNCGQFIVECLHWTWINLVSLESVNHWQVIRSSPFQDSIPHHQTALSVIT